MGPAKMRDKWKKKRMRRLKRKRKKMLSTTPNKGELTLRPTGCFYHQLVRTFCLCDDFYWNDVQARDATSTTCLLNKEHLTKIVQLCEDVSSFPCYHVYYHQNSK